MKLMIASDIHGSAYWCKKMLEAFEQNGAERLILLGDILYHGQMKKRPSKGICTKAGDSHAQSAKRQASGVRGNCDTEVDSNGA